jgi:hypothetical protein
MLLPFQQPDKIRSQKSMRLHTIQHDPTHAMLILQMLIPLPILLKRANRLLEVMNLIPMRELLAIMKEM